MDKIPSEMTDIEIAKALLNIRLVENVIVCDSDGDFKTLRNTIEAQFLGRASSELLEQILFNLDRLWTDLKGDRNKRLELSDLLKDWRDSLAKQGIKTDEQLVDYICEKLNQERNLG